MKDILKKLIFIILLVSGVSAANGDANDIFTADKEMLSELELPKPQTKGPYSVEQVLNVSPDFDEFSGRPLSLTLISQLLWAGINTLDPNSTAGTLFNLDRADDIRLYVLIRNGVYIYRPADNVILKVSGRDLRNDLAKTSAMKEIVADAPCSIVITTSKPQISKKFSDITDIASYILSGHIAQNIYLQAISLQLAVVPVPVKDSTGLNETLKLPPTHQGHYIISVGFATEAQKPVLQQKTGEDQQDQLKETEKPLKAVIIMPDALINDREYFDTVEVLAIADIQVDTAAPVLDSLRTDRRGYIEPEMLIRNINVEEYDIVVLISSEQIRIQYDNSPIFQVLRQARRQNKVIAAMGKAARVLGEANIVNGMILTGDPAARSALKNAGATFTNGRVEREGNIVTARSAEYVAQFGRLIKEAVLGQQSRIGTRGRYIDPRVLDRRGQDDDDLRRRDNRY